MSWTIIATPNTGAVPGGFSTAREKGTDSSQLSLPGLSKGGSERSPDSSQVTQQVHGNIQNVNPGLPLPIITPNMAHPDFPLKKQREALRRGLLTSAIPWSGSFTPPSMCFSSFQATYREFSKHIGKGGGSRSPETFSEPTQEAPRKCKTVQLLWKTVWQFPQKLNTVFP